MPFLGNLEDIPIGDVLQLLCVARKSGLLTVEGSSGTASLVLRDGEITGAHHPSPDLHVGTVLTEMGVAGAAEIEEALRSCASTGKPIVSTMVGTGRITREQGWAALAQLVERTVAAIVEWDKGRFSFDQQENELSDEFRYRLAVVEETVGGVDAQHVLMEVLRVFDERNRATTQSGVTAPEKPAACATAPAPAAPAGAPVEPAAAPSQTAAAPSPERERAAASAAPAPAAASPPASPPPERELARRPKPARSQPAATTRQAIVYSEDGLLRNLAGTTCEPLGIGVHAPTTEHHLLTRIQLCLTEATAPPLVVDIGSQKEAGAISKKQLALAERIRRKFPMLPLVLLGPQNRGAYLRAFEMGARGYLPRIEGSSEPVTDRARNAIRLVASYVEGYFRERDALCDELALARREMALLRNRVLRMTAPGTSDVSLIVLEHVADYLERCVIFVIRRTDLLGLGAFGLGPSAETMTSLVAGLKIPLDVPSVPRTVIEERTVFRGRIEDELLQKHLIAKIGPAASDEGLLLPLVGPERPIALIYADHGNKEPRPFATDPLEVLASVAGMALQRKVRAPALQS